MEQIVSEYEIPPAPAGASWKKKGLLFLAIVIFALAFHWILQSLFGWKHESLPRQLVLAVALGAVFTLRPFRVGQRATLVLGDGFLERRTETSSFKRKRRIERGAIKSIKEGRGGIMVMDRNEFAARMLGFIFIPRRLPEYQQVRSALSQWHPIEKRSWS